MKNAAKAETSREAKALRVVAKGEKQTRAKEKPSAATVEPGNGLSGESIGLDVGDRASQFCRLNLAGEIAEEGRLHTNAARIEKHFTKLPAAVAASMKFLLRMIDIFSMAIEEAAGDIEFLLKTRYPEALKRRQARGGPNANKRAIVAVARKLSVILHKLWRTGEDSVPFPA